MDGWTIYSNLERLQVKKEEMVSREMFLIMLEKLQAVLYSTCIYDEVACWDKIH